MIKFLSILCLFAVLSNAFVSNTCWNSNNVLVSKIASAAGYEYNRPNSGDDTYGAFCHEIAIDTKLLQSSKTPWDFQAGCVSKFGSVCRNKCLSIARLFEKVSYVNFPPQQISDKPIVFNKLRCFDCLKYGDCNNLPVIRREPRPDDTLLFLRGPL